MKRSIDTSVQQKINELIRKSVAYAFDHYPELADYVRKHSQEMSESVMRQHIDLYVNNFSIDLGENGKKAVKKLLEVYQQLNHTQSINEENIFID